MAESLRPETVRGIDIPPTQKQLHGLAGELMKVAYESGCVRRRSYMDEEDAMKRVFLPDWSTSIEPLDGYGQIEQIDKRIVASLGAVAHRFWSLRIRITDTRASYAHEVDENDPAGVGPIPIEQLFASVAPDVGMQSQYSFEWNRSKILKAERQIQTISSSHREIPTVQELIERLPRTDIDLEFAQVQLLSEISNVSSADIDCLRSEVAEYRTSLTKRLA